MNSYNKIESKCITCNAGINRLNFMIANHFSPVGVLI